MLYWKYIDISHTYKRFTLTGGVGWLKMTDMKLKLHVLHFQVRHFHCPRNVIPLIRPVTIIPSFFFSNIHHELHTHEYIIYSAALRQNCSRAIR